jgi:hypothetical protein
MSDLAGIVAALPSPWLENLVDTFEAGRVQRHPHARFVNARGECCLVAALAGARTSFDLVDSELWRGFNGSALEQLSRAFEARRLTAAQVYDEALLVLAARAEVESLIGV